MAVFNTMSKAVPESPGNDPTPPSASNTKFQDTHDDLGFSGPQLSKHDEFTLANSHTRKR